MFLYKCVIIIYNTRIIFIIINAFIINKDYSCVINNNNTLIQEPLKYSFLLSLDNLNISKEIKNQFNIYIGSQSISNIKQSDVILPIFVCKTPKILFLLI